MTIPSVQPVPSVHQIKHGLGLKKEKTANKLKVQYTFPNPKIIFIQILLEEGTYIMLIMRDKIFSISQKGLCNRRILKVLYTFRK